jgi:hypothetical protein
VRIPDLFHNLAENMTLGLEWSGDKSEAVAVIAYRHADGSIEIVWIGKLTASAVERSEPLVAK